MRMLDLIAAKRDGCEHSPAELSFISKAAAEGGAPDYQLSAWLMAVCLRGMTRAETVALTEAMARWGKRLDLSGLRGRKVDKHSTGGVGDGVSLALAPLLAAAGVVVPMMSGRGLGHTGGTLDKLESVSGLRVRLDFPQVERQLRSIGVCMFGQSQELAPSDRKLYALRDATGTVGSLPLIVSSILSKKLAEGIDALVLDVKCGLGAIFEEPAKASALARELMAVAKGLGLRCVAFLTGMDEPLGLAVGNALEMRQAIEVLHGDFAAADYVEVLLALGAEMAVLGGKARTREQGVDLLRRLIREGKAAARLKAMIRAQGGDPRVVDDPSRFLPAAPKSVPLPAPSSGFLTRLDARTVGRAAVLLGAGRDRMEDQLDYGAGIRLHKKLGDAVRKGDPVATLYASEPSRLKAARGLMAGAVEIGARRPRPRPVVRATWR